MKPLLPLALVLLAGCAAPPQLSREEALKITSRTYDNTPKEKVIAAAERLLRLADGSDFVIQHVDEGFSASRPWGVYMVLAAVRGTDYWQFKAVQEGGATRASVLISTQAQGQGVSMAPSTGSWGTSMQPLQGSAVNGTAIYDVFWSRMDYLLGMRSDWMSCDQANARVQQKVVWGDNSALCNAFNMTDETPRAPLEK